MTRAERYAQCKALRDQGLLLREIGERLGIATSTVFDVLSDPTGEKVRARKDSYRGVCDTCGRPTDGSAGASKAPKRCLDCIMWSREALLAWVDGWADAHGGVPPRLSDFSGAYRAARRHFGSWNGLLLAAGFALHCDRRAETAQAILAAVRAGESTKDIAARYGVTTGAIEKRLQSMGTSISRERPAHVTRRMQIASGRRLAAARWGSKAAA